MIKAFLVSVSRPEAAIKEKLMRKNEIASIIKICSNMLVNSRDNCVCSVFKKFKIF